MTKSLEERVQLIEDRQEISDLQTHYINCNDGGWLGPTHGSPEHVAGLFTEDGVWEGPLGSVRVQGHAAIAELFHQFQVIPFIVHNVMNPLIEIDGNRARGEWHAIIATTTAEGQAFWTFGRYLNEYSRTPQGWRYTRMSFEAAAVSTYEKGWGVEQFPGQDAVRPQFDTSIGSSTKD
ncbi:MAG TPA: nuclear transport factor 2 family protein [Mycobacterium sp.]